jgi:hypothetical protein
MEEIRENKDYFMSKEQFLSNQIAYWVNTTIKELRNYEEPDKEIVTKKTLDLSKTLKKLVDKKISNGEKEYKDIIFFIHFIDAFLNKIVNINIGDDNIINNLIFSQFNKFSYVFWLCINNQYESSIILFRSLYEGLVIILFLLRKESKDCIHKFGCASMYKINNIFNKTNLQELHDELMKNPDPKLKELHSKMGFEKYKPEDLLSRYGWARKGIKDEDKKYKIEFTDILEEVFHDENYKIMYRVASSFVHSNMAGSSTNVMVDFLKNMILSYIRNFCIPVFKDIFLNYLLYDDIEKYLFKNVWENINNDLL